jgi:hypothetical protein
MLITVTTVSARVASAILALRVSDAEARIAEPSAETTTSSTAPPEDPDVEDSAAPDTTAVGTASASSSESSPSTTATPTTTAPTTTQPRDTTPPDLHVTSPSDGDTVEDRVVTFYGTSEPGAKVYSGPYEASVDDDGDWTLKLVVSSEGSNARITAEDKAGNTATESVLVTYSPPPPPPPATTTTTKGTPTTSPATTWSPNWPADAAGKRNVEEWRTLVAKYWPDHLVNCALNIIHFESKGNPQAYNSSVGAEGLFQHLSKYWKARAAAAGFRDSNGLYATPYNAEANIAVSWYLAKSSSPWDRHWSVDPQHPNAPLECTE